MFSLILIPLVISMFLSLNMGASGTAPAFSASYGANIIRKDLIPGLFGIFVFLGAVIAGKNVSLTIGRSLIPADMMSVSLTTIIFLSVSISLFFANILGVPQSTSQSTVFAVSAAGIYFDDLNTKKLFFEIIPSWFLLPAAAFVIIFFTAKLFYRKVQDKGWVNFKEIGEKKWIRYFVIAASCYAAFSIGANNVANGSGLITSMVIKELGLDHSAGNILLITILATLIIAPCFGIGSSILGSKNLETTGKEIVTFGPLGASLVCLITASLLLFASIAGIPVSEVQLSTGAIIGLGICKEGFGSISGKRSFKKILTVWAVSPVMAFMLSLALVFLADSIGLL